MPSVWWARTNGLGAGSAGSVASRSAACVPPNKVAGATSRETSIGAPGFSAARWSRSATDGSREIGLAEQQAVGERDLTACLGMAIERRGSVQRINDRNHAIDRVLPHDVAIGHQCMQDRRRIGEAGCFDQHPIVADLARFTAALQVEQRRDEVAADRTAQAAGGERQQCFVAAGDEFVVEADLAELVDDDGGAGEGRVAQDTRDERGLAAAEEPCDDGDRNHGVRQ